MATGILQGAAAAVLLGCLALTGCGQSDAPPAPADPPAQVEHSVGTGIARITLSPDAAQRIGVRTDVVKQEVVNGTPKKVVPYGAVLYDPTGATYTYGNPQPLVYVRVPVTVDHIDGERALLSDGPPVGTVIVTVGATELFGTEFAVGGG